MSRYRRVSLNIKRLIYRIDFEKIKYFKQYLPSISDKDLLNHFLKIKKLKNFENQKKCFIIEYRDTRRKLNIINYREIQKENLQLENVNKSKIFIR